MDERLYSVTISHQIGSGGAYLGEQLSNRLGIPFLDRAILKEVARQLDMAEAELEGREERLSSFWENFARLAVLTDPTYGMASRQYIPSDGDVFQAECSTIQRIAEKNSAIFLGRCGFYVLRNHPRHVSILLTANLPARVKRLHALHEIPEDKALDLIKINDQERANYVHGLTRQNWLDASHYDLCINTTSIGLDYAVELAEKCILAKLR
jgi:cytidylate kinase